MGGSVDGVERYLRCAVATGTYPSEARLRAHVEALFSGIDLAGKRVLDIGGGVGLLSLYAAARGAIATCLEPEADGSTRGAATVFDDIAGCAGLSERVTLLHSTLQAHRASVPYDVVVMANSVNHIDEAACIKLAEDRMAFARYVQLFQDVLGMLSAGGILIMTDCDRSNLFHSLGLRSPLVPTIEWHKHQHPLLWSGVLRDAGFVEVAYGWSPPNRLGRIGRALLANRLAAFLLTGMFRIVAERPR